ncbi:MAG: type II secretion system protein [Magnetococcales bacterium]|nr:type II secretion system protein [Magnetococcales bacterium]
MPSATGVAQRRRMAGFTLVEMAIALVVFSMVLVGGLQALQSQSRKQTLEKAQAEMRAIQDALLGFLTVNGRLPCPDTDFDGVEQGACAAPNQEGSLPWNTLGVKPLDPWGQLYTYRVTPAYALSITGVGAGDITIRNASGVDLATGIPLIVLSRGRNGLGGRSMSGTAMAAPTLAAELANTLNNGIFVFGAGDDLLLWLPPDVVRHHALKSGYTL